MASITIRNLDEATKQALRERAARNGRSMEEEARILLAGGGNDEADSGDPASAFHRVQLDTLSGKENYPGLNGKKAVLVIGGGIAAYKCLELIRRLRENVAALHALQSKGHRDPSTSPPEHLDLLQYASQRCRRQLAGTGQSSRLWEVCSRQKPL